MGGASSKVNVTSACSLTERFNFMRTGMSIFPPAGTLGSNGSVSVHPQLGTARLIVRSRPDVFSSVKTCFTQVGLSTIETVPKSCERTPESGGAMNHWITSQTNPAARARPIKTASPTRGRRAWLDDSWTEGDMRVLDDSPPDTAGLAVASGRRALFRAFRGGATGIVLAT
tara:strand:- start:86 stop:598 length:513 start_codon:yes stop_codon:yes gene_type:complete